MFLVDLPFRYLLLLFCCYDVFLYHPCSEISNAFFLHFHFNNSHTHSLPESRLCTGIFLSAGVLLLCFVGAYWQPCNAIVSSRMVCVSDVGDIQAVEPHEWWTDGKNPCRHDQWRCRDDKMCIPPGAVCSNTTECEDGSDESPRFCGEWRCVVLYLVTVVWSVRLTISMTDCIAVP